MRTLAVLLICSIFIVYEIQHQPT